MKRSERRFVASLFAMPLLLPALVVPAQVYRAWQTQGQLAPAIESHDTARALDLLARGADPHGRGSKGDSLLMTAVRYSEKKVLRDLLARGAKPDANTRLFIAACEGKPADVAQALGAGADPNARDFEGDTPLVYPVMEGDLATMRVLIGGKADVNARSKEGMTPLDWAQSARVNGAAVAAMLRRHGAK